jgi:hypothetical protein
LRCCNRLNGFIDFCGKTNPEANCDANTDSSANGNARADGDSGANGNADTNSHPGCRNKPMPASGGLWSQQLKHKYKLA